VHNMVGRMGFPFGMRMILYLAQSSKYNTGMAKKRSNLLTDQLRQAIDDSGQTRYRIAKECGINESALCLFYNGHRGLSMESMNALGEYLDLMIVPRKTPLSKKRKGK
jgi:hypothetical protein